jgi:hypothetical protein
MRSLARLHRHLPLSSFRGHYKGHAWPPTADASHLYRRLASSSSSATAAASREKSSRRTLGYLVGVAVAMVGASYAAVPLYRRFCQATGYGGTVQRREVWFRSYPNHHTRVRFGFDPIIGDGYLRCSLCASWIGCLIWSMLTAGLALLVGFVERLALTQNRRKSL